MAKRKKINSYPLFSVSSSDLHQAFVQFCTLLHAKQSLIFVDTGDYELFDMMLQSANERKALWKDNRLENHDIIEYWPGLGEMQFEDKDASTDNLIDGEASLRNFLYRYVLINEKYDDSILVLRDIGTYLDADSLHYAPEIVEALRLIAGNNMTSDGARLFVVIVGFNIQIPPMLMSMSSLIRLPKLSEKEIEILIRKWEEENDQQKCFKNLDDIIPYLTGLAMTEIYQILDLVNVKTTDNALQIIHNAKQAIIEKTGLLKLVQVPGENELAGLNGLKKYLEEVKWQVALAIARVDKIKVAMPRGILLVGMPGCGKSLVAKVAAGLLQRPLIQMDIGRLMGKYVGESEANMRMALELAEMASPCVLWIDEMEKAFSGLKADSDGGASRRLFGHFLTWMQEKTKDVYVIATANALELMPPELMRKGRFDEIFKIMLPTQEERKQLFETHCNKFYNLDSKNSSHERSLPIDCNALAQKACWKEDDELGFSGADIAGIVERTVHRYWLTYVTKKIPKKPNEGGTQQDSEIEKETVADRVEKIKKIDFKEMSFPGQQAFEEEIENTKGHTQRDILGEKYEDMVNMLEMGGYRSATEG